ncbi:ACP S-malonyltransferase [bacterium]|nr:ACP S-malonyltransferase [bacterium]
MGKTAFIFPGQGSQIVGMGKDLYGTYPEAARLFDMADRILDTALTSVCFEGPEDQLKETRFTQPAVFTHSLIVAGILAEAGFYPDCVAGHSLGELAALCFSGAFSFENGLSLVRERGRLMSDCAVRSPGTMAAVIGMDPGLVRAVCNEAASAGIVQPANFNSPVQIVISGSREGVVRAMEIAGQKGAKRIIELPVSGAFHSPLMEDASVSFRSIVESVAFDSLKIPVYANVTAERVSSETDIPDLLSRQLTHPVRWIEIIENMAASGVTRFIETGPGKILAGLVKRIVPQVETISIGTVEDINAFKIQQG